MPAQTLDGGAELPRPRPRNRIVKRDDEARGRSRVEPPLDQLPRLEIVGQRQRAEIVAEWRADARSDGEHRGNARYDLDVERAPARRSGFDLLAHGRGHGEHSRIAAGNDRDARPLRGVIERRGRARAFLAVVGSVAALPGARRHAVEIRHVAVERIRGRERRGSLRSEVAGIARTQSDNGEMPAHGRPSQPGTSTTAKYGASSSGLALSGIITASAMVPCST